MLILSYLCIPTCCSATVYLLYTSAQSTVPVKVPIADESSYLIPTFAPQPPLTVIVSNTCGVQRESVWALKLNVFPSVVPSITVNVREKPMPGCEMVKLPVTVPSPPADILMIISPGTAGSHVTVPLPPPLIVKPPRSILTVDVIFVLIK